MHICHSHLHTTLKHTHPHECAPTNTHTCAHTQLHRHTCECVTDVTCSSSEQQCVSSERMLSLHGPWVGNTPDWCAKVRTWTHKQEHYSGKSSQLPVGWDGSVCRICVDAHGWPCGISWFHSTHRNDGRYWSHVMSWKSLMRPVTYDSTRGKWRVGGHNLCAESREHVWTLHRPLTCHAVWTPNMWTHTQHENTHLTWEHAPPHTSLCPYRDEVVPGSETRHQVAPPVRHAGDRHMQPSLGQCVCVLGKDGVNAASAHACKDTELGGHGDGRSGTMCSCVQLWLSVYTDTHLSRAIKLYPGVTGPSACILVSSAKANTNLVHACRAGSVCECVSHLCMPWMTLYDVICLIHIVYMSVLYTLQCITHTTYYNILHVIIYTSLHVCAWCTVPHVIAYMWLCAISCSLHNTHHFV